MNARPDERDIRTGRPPQWINGESVRIRIDGRDFHALIGDADMDANARISATYELITSDLPIYGEWILIDRFGHRFHGPHTCLRIATRNAITYIDA